MQNADHADDDTVVSSRTIDDDRTISTRTRTEDDDTVVGGRGAGLDEKTHTVIRRRVNSAVGAVENGRIAFVPVTQREHYEVRSVSRTAEPVVRTSVPAPVRERSRAPAQRHIMRARALIATVVVVTGVTAGIVALILAIALR